MPSAGAGSLQASSWARTQAEGFCRQPSFTWKSWLWQDPCGSGRNTGGSTRGKKTAAPPFALSSPSAVGPHLHRTLSEEQAPHTLVQRTTHVSARSQRRVPLLQNVCADINQNQLNCPPLQLQFVVSSGIFFHFVPGQLLKLVTSLSTQSPCRLQGVSARLRQRKHRKALL